MKKDVHKTLNSHIPPCFFIKPKKKTHISKSKLTSTLLLLALKQADLLTQLQRLALALRQGLLQTTQLGGICLAALHLQQHLDLVAQLLLLLLAVGVRLAERLAFELNGRERGLWFN